MLTLSAAENRPQFEGRRPQLRLGHSLFSLVDRQPAVNEFVVASNELIQ